MGYSSVLGISAETLSNSEMELIAELKTDEDQIYKEVCEYIGSRFIEENKPTKIRERIASNNQTLSELFPGLDRETAIKALDIRLDRCLVASLASTLKNQENIVETGTYTGFTSWFAIHGLTKSTGGLLFSIDIPTSTKTTQQQVHCIAKNRIGELVKNDYQNRFVQIIEDAKTSLQRTLLNHSTGIFIHDSMHTHTHMMYEYIVARTFTRPNSITISDDILMSRAFWGYINAFQSQAWICSTNPNFGIILNQPFFGERGFSWGPVKVEDYLLEKNESSINLS